MSSQITSRKLGKNGPQVPSIGFGGMGLSVYYGEPGDDAQRLAVLDRTYELGSRYWDTADMYDDNEDLIGLWFSKNPQKRRDIFLASKFGCIITETSFGIRRDAAYVKEACAKSLKRLGVEYIGLYYCHRLDEKTPIEKTVGAMVELNNEGKIKYLGLSEVPATSLRRAQAVNPIAAIEMEYSPFELAIEHTSTPILATARELGVALVAYSPLGRGIMTGQYTSPEDFEEMDLRRMMPRYAKENFPKNLVLVQQFKEIGAKRGLSSTQVCLAVCWLRGKTFL
ncbi:aldo-keto reductase [Calycina marina]|uniref:Aldo-keto reductase n=1 Tax=Calycina marina TaxID=1763456 RepID=A0A9P7YYW0_9HELO|nr:aldo-keto reductase [Calycina marina]